MTKKPDKAKATAAQNVGYVVVTPINYGTPERRAEAGETVYDLPPSALAWLLQRGAIQSQAVTPTEGGELHG